MESQTKLKTVMIHTIFNGIYIHVEEDKISSLQQI